MVEPTMTKPAQVFNYHVVFLFKNAWTKVTSQHSIHNCVVENG